MSLLAVAAMLLVSACGGGGVASGVVQPRVPDGPSTSASQSVDRPPADSSDSSANGPPVEAEAPAKTQDPPGNEPADEPDTPPESKPPADKPAPPGNEPADEPDTPPESEPPADKPVTPGNEPADEPDTPPESELPADKPDTTKTEPPADDPRATEIAGVRIHRVQIDPDENGQPAFTSKEGDFVNVPGRLDLVDELERCLADSDSGCRSAENWLFQIEYDPYHKKIVSLAIQAGAGDVTRDYFPAVVYNFNLNESSFTPRLRDGTIPEGAWINRSLGSGFSSSGTLDVPLMIEKDVVVAIPTGNRIKPYTQLTGLRDDELLEQAVLNTAVIFVYSLNNESSGVVSSHCGAQIMNVCIGMHSDNFLTYEGVRYRLSGASSATGHLSGAAWLMKSLWPYLTSKQIARIMLATARPLHDGDPPADEITGVGALDFTALLEPVGPLMAKELGADDLVLERGFLHLPGLTDFDNPEGVDSFARNFQLVTSTLSIQPGFADFDLDRFTPLAPGSRLHLAVRKRNGGAEDAALAFGHTNKLVLSSRYIGLCRDGQNTDLCLTTTRRADFFGGQGSGSFRLEDTTYTSLAATHKMPLKDRLELGFGAAVTEARTSGKHLVGDVEGRLLQTELSLRNKKDTRSRKTSTSMSVWGSKFDGSMDMRGKQSPLHERSYGVRLRWQLDF